MRLLRSAAILGIAAAFLAMPVVAGAQLVITNVYDCTLTGGLPKGIELCVLTDIPDLSLYGVGSANNGGGTDGQEFTFPAVTASAGTFIYVSSDSAAFNTWFGFDSDYQTSAMLINGDDAIEVFCGGNVIDTFGDINVDGTGTAWDYVDSWASRVSGTAPDGATFVISNWTFGGPDALDGETSNASAANPVPIGTYAHPAVPVEPTTWGKVKNLGKTSE